MKKEVERIKALRRLEKRLTARNKKIFQKIFLELNQKIIEDNSSAYDVKAILKIDYVWLTKKFRKGLETLYTYTFDETIKGFQYLQKDKKAKKNSRY